MIPLRLSLFLLASLCALPAVRAHTLEETSLVLSNDEENLAVLVTLSLPAAAALLPADANPPLSPASFEQYRPALVALVARVCTLVGADDAPLAPDRVLVSLRADQDVRFHLLFPASSQPARLRVPLLAKLPRDGFCAVSDLRFKNPLQSVLGSATPDLALPSASR